VEGVVQQLADRGPLDRPRVPVWRSRREVGGAVEVGEDPTVTLEMLHRGQTLASVPVELSLPIPQGRVQHVGKLPIDKFPSGTYELRLRLRSGATEEVRNAFFTIAQ